MVLRKLIVYSIASPNFGLALLTVFVAVSLPAFVSGTTGTSGSSGGLTVSSTLALLRIVFARFGFFVNDHFETE